MLSQLPFSGASMNPFRTLGSALTENYWDDIWVSTKILVILDSLSFHIAMAHFLCQNFHFFQIYFVGPPAGAALSAVLYRFVLSGAKESSL